MVTLLDFIDRLLCTKQIFPCGSTAEEVSFEWSHHWISSTDYYVQNKSSHVEVLLKRFHLNGHTIGFHQQTTMYKTNHTM